MSKTKLDKTDAFERNVWSIIEERRRHNRDDALANEMERQQEIRYHHRAQLRAEARADRLAFILWAFASIVGCVVFGWFVVPWLHGL